MLHAWVFNVVSSEDEVKAALGDPATQFLRGPRTMTERGTSVDDASAFEVEDGRYVSARWPGDAYCLRAVRRTPGATAVRPNALTSLAVAARSPRATHGCSQGLKQHPNLDAWNTRCQVRPALNNAARRRPCGGE